MRVALFYFVFLGITGLVLPYFQRYLDTLGFSPAQIATVNSIGPVLLIFVPLIWGFIADKTGRPVLMLKIACAFMLISLLPLGAATSFAGVMAVWLCYAFSLSPIIPLADSVAIVEAQRIGTDFARLRLWGSIGFLAVLFAFGIYIDHGGDIHHLPDAAVLLAAATLVCGLLLKQHAPAPHRKPPSFADARKLAHNSALMWFLIAGMVHQMSMSPYYLFYPLHLKTLKMGESVIYWSIGVGVIAEIIMFQFVRSVLKRYAVLPLVGASIFIGALRWFFLPQIEVKAGLILLQTTHAFTFALCYAGSIAYLESEVDEPLRATGRALYSAAQGLGTVTGHQLAGWFSSRENYRSSFKVAAALEVVALVPLLASAWYAARHAPRVAGDPFEDVPPAVTEEV